MWSHPNNPCLRPISSGFLLESASSHIPNTPPLPSQPLSFSTLPPGPEDPHPSTHSYCIYTPETQVRAASAFGTPLTWFNPRIHSSKLKEEKEVKNSKLKRQRWNQNLYHPPHFQNMWVTIGTFSKIKFKAKRTKNNTITGKGVKLTLLVICESIWSLKNYDIKDLNNIINKVIYAHRTDKYTGAWMYCDYICIFSL